MIHDAQRHTLQTALQRLAQGWRLTETETADLLGVEHKIWSAVAKREVFLEFDEQLLLRSSALLGIDKALSAIFSEPLRSGWHKTINDGSLFDGKTPLELMIDGGLPAIINVRRHLEALGGI